MATRSICWKSWLRDPASAKTTIRSPMTESTEPPITDGSAGELLRWIEKVGISPLTEKAAGSSWVGPVRSAVQAAASNPALVHGLRTENMFAAILPALGETSLLTREDTGAPEHSTEEVKAPDYRVVLNSGSKFLVEVKNHRTSKAAPIKPFSMRASDFAAYNKYATLSGEQLLFAVYWSNWGFWSLNKPGSFEVRNRKAWLDFDTAMQSNRLSEFGDRWLFPEFPLSLVFEAQEGTVTEDEGQMSFTVGAVDFYCAGRKLKTKSDQALATYLTFWGDWDLASGDAYAPEGVTKGVEYIFRPDHEPEDVPFAGIGSWSRMLAKQFLYNTARDRGAERLDVRRSLPELNKLLESGAEHTDLGLRVMHLRPVGPGEVEGS